MKGSLVLAALVGIGAGVAACICNPGVELLDSVYTVSEQTGFVPAATEMEVQIGADDVVLVHEGDLGVLRVHYKKVERIGP